MLFLDIETQSPLDIRDVGGPVYWRSVEHVPVMCWALAEGEVHTWLPGEPLDWLTDYLGPLVAHNAEFERGVLLHYFGISTPIERWFDTAALARSYNLPGKLEEIGEFLGYPKDMDGNRVMLRLCKPRRPSKANPSRFWTPSTKPEEFQALYRYCAQDVLVSREVWRALPMMRPTELRRYRLTMRMNARGVKVDMAAVANGIALAQTESDALSARITELTGYSATQTVKLAEAVGMDSLAKHKLRDALKDQALDIHTREILELRQRFAKSSVAKLRAFDRRAVDGSIFDSLVYGGAERTLRWTGAGAQLQNLPRGAGPVAVPVMDRLSREGVLPRRLWDADGALHEGANEILKQCLRAVLVGPFLVGDFAQIEARLLAYIAGDDKLLHAFATGADPYRLKASEIFHCTPEEVTKPQRFMGKQTVLGCGYGIGPATFRELLDTTYDVQIDEDEAAALVRAYRRSSPRVVALWRRIDRAIDYSREIAPKTVWIIIDQLSIKWHDNATFTLKLPSGRELWYRRVSRDHNGRWTAYGRSRTTKRMGQVPIHGGALTGHVVQSTARDIMAEALERLEDAGFEPLLSVHDEALCEGSADELPRFRQVMEIPPAWAKGLPIKVDCFHAERYHK